MSKYITRRCCRRYLGWDGLRCAPAASKLGVICLGKSVLRSEIEADLIESASTFDKVELVILKSTDKLNPESNLLIFSASTGELLNRPEPPVSAESQWDCFVNSYVKANKIMVGSWSGYSYEVDKSSGQLIEGKFTK